MWNSPTWRSSVCGMLGSTAANSTKSARTVTGGSARRQLLGPPRQALRADPVGVGEGAAAQLALAPSGDDLGGVGFGPPRFGQGESEGLRGGVLVGHSPIVASRRVDRQMGFTEQLPGCCSGPVLPSWPSTLGTGDRRFPNSDPSDHFCRTEWSVLPTLTLYC